MANRPLGMPVTERVEAIGILWVELIITPGAGANNLLLRQDDYTHRVLDKQLAFLKNYRVEEEKEHAILRYLLSKDSHRL